MILQNHLQHFLFKLTSVLYKGNKFFIAERYTLLGAFLVNAF